MTLFELTLLSVGLAMDAFSVALCKGLSMKKINYAGGFITALFFGVFQAAMPLIGYFLGSRFESFISHFSHWIAFILLGFIGGKMIWEAVRGSDEDTGTAEYKLDLKDLTVLSIATSIDALAVGIVFAAQGADLLLSVTMIGAITFALSFIAVIIGSRFGSIFGSKAEIAGGCILIFIGVKLLLEGLGIL